MAMMVRSNLRAGLLSLVVAIATIMWQSPDAMVVQVANAVRLGSLMRPATTRERFSRVEVAQALAHTNFDSAFRDAQEAFHAGDYDLSEAILESVLETEQSRNIREAEEADLAWAIEQSLLDEREREQKRQAEEAELQQAIRLSLQQDQETQQSQINEGRPGPGTVEELPVDSAAGNVKVMEEESSTSGGSSGGQAEEVIGSATAAGLFAASTLFSKSSDSGSHMQSAGATAAQASSLHPWSLLNISPKDSAFAQPWPPLSVSGVADAEIVDPANESTDASAIAEVAPDVAAYVTPLTAGADDVYPISTARQLTTTSSSHSSFGTAVTAPGILEQGPALPDQPMIGGDASKYIMLYENLNVNLRLTKDGRIEFESLSPQSFEMLRLWGFMGYTKSGLPALTEGGLSLVGGSSSADAEAGLVHLDSQGRSLVRGSTELPPNEQLAMFVLKNGLVVPDLKHIGNFYWSPDFVTRLRMKIPAVDAYVKDMLLKAWQGTGMGAYAIENRAPHVDSWLALPMQVQDVSTSVAPVPDSDSSITTRLQLDQAGVGALEVSPKAADDQWYASAWKSIIMPAAHRRLLKGQTTLPMPPRFAANFPIAPLNPRPALNPVDRTQSQKLSENDWYASWMQRSDALSSSSAVTTDKFGMNHYRGNEVELNGLEDTMKTSSLEDGTNADSSAWIQSAISRLSDNVREGGNGTLGAASSTSATHTGNLGRFRAVVSDGIPSVKETLLSGLAYFTWGNHSQNRSSNYSLWGGLGSSTPEIFNWLARS